MLSHTSCNSISLTAATISFASAWRLDVNAWMYLRHELVVTRELTNPVVVIASCRPLASVSEFALHKLRPSLQAVNNQEEEMLEDISSINPLDPSSPARPYVSVMLRTVDGQ